MIEKNENEPSHAAAARECEVEMMTGLSRLFGEAYMRGYAQGRNDGAADSCNRITELEARLAHAQEVVRETSTIAKQALPSSDLDAAREAYFSLGGIESDIGPRNDSSWYWRRAAKMAIAQLESRSAKQAPPVDATGKTPGELLRAAFESMPGEADCADAHEGAAKAVIDAFGNQRAVEVLRRVRLELECRDVVRVDFEYASQLPLWSCAVVESVLSDELAKLT